MVWPVRHTARRCLLQISFRKAGIYEFNPSVVNKSLFKPAEVLKKIRPDQKEEVDDSVVDGKNQDDVDMQPEIEISIEVKSVESDKGKRLTGAQ